MRREKTKAIRTVKEIMFEGKKEEQKLNLIKFKNLKNHISAHFKIYF